MASLSHAPLLEKQNIISLKLGVMNTCIMAEIRQCLGFLLLLTAFHEYGSHLFTLNSSVFNNTVQDISLE